ncbi:MAG TPA: hypothetical protein VMU27_02975 [Candidatus Paceibacterota bacterium]|nr:hypothetical protein [Candidatus Paceibacterota bacterium]
MKDVQGSNVFSNVCGSGAATWYAASLAAICIIFLLPRVCAADGTTNVTWGSIVFDDTGAVISDDEVHIQDGGTFAVPLNVTEPLLIHNSSYPDVYGELYSVATSGERTYMGRYDGNGSATLAWNTVGTYEIDVYSTYLNTPPITTWSRAREFFFGGTVFAIALAPFFQIDTIHFTITDKNTPAAASNVLFLPGIEASRLYDTDGGETQLWEPGGDVLSQNLALDSSGHSIRSDIFTRDIIDTGYGLQDIYKSFIQSMNILKYSGAINDWAATPYDWRLSLDQILSSGLENGSNISYTSSTNTPYIIQELKQLAATSRSGKVTIVAHSNGGLVAKALTERLGDDASKYIDKIIFVAVPQVGTPAAVAGLLNGYEQGISIPDWGWISWIPGVMKISDGEVRALGDNAPGIYNLLPSANYFRTISTPVVTFSTTTSEWAAKYGSSITNESMLTMFLTDSSGRKNPDQSNTADPTILNALLLSQAQTVHNNLDAWIPPQGIQLIQIAGWGVPSTVSGITYGRGIQDGTTTVIETPQFTIEGDDTVVVPSALWTSTTTGAVNYWLNLRSINNGWLSNVIPTFAIGHNNILEVSQLDSFISDIITNSQQSLSAYQYLSTTSPVTNSGVKRLEYALHSPLTLDLYDNQGRHTGISTSTGMVEEQIPSTYYTELGGVKYIFADEGSPQTLTMSGYASGVFTLNVNEVQDDDTIVASTTFANIPTTPQTTATISIPDSLSSESNLVVQSGSTTLTLAPKLNDIVTPDITPPITTASATGTIGLNGWYISNVLVTLSATDTESGVASTLYSIDNGIHWLPDSATSSILLSQEGTTTIHFFSTDNAGNSEPPSIISVKIDKTPPEAHITFDLTAQSIIVAGSDNLSSTTVSTTATSSIIKDAAGHSLLISFPLFIPKGIFASANISKLSYDGNATTTSALLDYASWIKSDGSYLILASFLKTKSTVLESHYRPKLNLTYIMASPGIITPTMNDDSCEFRPISRKLPGMVVPGLETNKGNLSIYY